MPEAVKEAQEILPSDKKEGEAQKPTEGCSGTLPADKSENLADGAKPEEGLEADQPPISAEQPVIEGKPSGSVPHPEMNGGQKDPLEGGDAPAINGADGLPEGALLNGSGEKLVTNKDEGKEDAQEEGSNKEEAKKVEESNKKEAEKEEGSNKEETKKEDDREEVKIHDDKKKTEEKPGGSGCSSSNPKLEEEIQSHFIQGKKSFALGEYEAAAEHLGKACETAASHYGDLSERVGELYFDYGCALLECGKIENTLLGEGVKDEVKQKDNDDDDEEEEILPQVIDKTKDPEPADNAKGEEMDVDSTNNEEESNEEKDSKDGNEETEKQENKNTEESEDVGEGDHEEDSAEEDDEDVEEETTEDKEGGENEEDESSLKVAWEVFELAKLVFTKFDCKNRLVDTYMKLGEVNFESGNITATEDITKAIDLLYEVNPDELRSLSHMHFQLGLMWATFEKFDEATTQFKKSKELLLKKISQLQADTTSKGAKDEEKEIRELLPDLDEKIADMEDSRNEKLKEAANGEAEKEEELKMDDSKPATNISHLVKRKRKADEIASEIQEPAPKQAAVEETS